MPFYNFKCTKCGYENEFMVGGPTGKKEPTICPECQEENTMEKQFSMSGISGEVVGGYEYEYGKKSWKRTASPMKQAGILSGDVDPY